MCQLWGSSPPSWLSATSTRPRVAEAIAETTGNSQLWPEISYVINRLLERDGSLWQDGYWDRMIRHERHLYRCKEYIRENPANANLPPGNYQLWEK